MKKNGIHKLLLCVFLGGSTIHAGTATEADLASPSAKSWQPEPAILETISQIPDEKQREIVRYGKELFLHTAYYLGPKGKVSHHTSRMNCQNCHLDGGTRKFGNDLVHTAARYPSYRAREGRVLSLKERINNCIERPLSGKALPVEGTEMTALHAYISWLNTLPLTREYKMGENLMEVKFPSRAANLKKGAALFVQQCARCHGAHGEGQLHLDEISFAYPPLWGKESFSAGSSMARVLKMASFVKTNMPFGTTWDRPALTDEEAIDVAAFVTDPKHFRPVVWDLKHDYPKVEEKPIDLAIGPYVDAFSEKQHRLGPFGPIEEFYRKRKVVSDKHLPVDPPTQVASSSSK